MVPDAPCSVGQCPRGWKPHSTSLRSRLIAPCHRRRHRWRRPQSLLWVGCSHRIGAAQPAVETLLVAPGGSCRISAELWMVTAMIALPTTVSWSVVRPRARVMSRCSRGAQPASRPAHAKRFAGATAARMLAEDAEHQGLSSFSIGGVLRHISPQDRPEPGFPRRGTGALMTGTL